MNVLWLYSYPKTGSTWVRRVIQEILAPELSPFEAISSVQHELPKAPVSFEVWGTEMAIFKTHNPPGHPADGRVGLKDAGYISVYRHPLDVLLSSLNYSFIKGESRIFKGGILKNVDQIIQDDEIGHYIGQFIHHQGCRRYVKLCGGYAEYYRNWETVAARGPHLMLRYEDIVADKVKAITSIAHFIGREDADCTKIYEKIEEKTAIDGRFHWRKKAYNFEGYVPRRFISKFERSCADVLNYFGYEPTIQQRQKQAEVALPGDTTPPTRRKPDKEL
ncbi:sulfotransferase domain-containing protein [Novosphingobium mathurense]|nr:sulfotransferase domain-containing protein [Novosphingobium mathurense]